MGEWLRRQSAFAQDRCIDRLMQLRTLGHELRRPWAAPLRGGVFELRVRERKVRVRMLYFFHGRGVAVVSHGFRKSGSEVPPREIDRALARKTRYQADPEGCYVLWEP
ncbi:MAG: type II toxin-antitoxin system RelE/ParE family toxin [Thermodesulfobacteriota bacterium]